MYYVLSDRWFTGRARQLGALAAVVHLLLDLVNFLTN